jgi:hypothetical protein
MILLLLGEKAGMRASVSTIFNERQYRLKVTIIGGGAMRKRQRADALHDASRDS